jgi:hypothetical protein
MAYECFDCGLTFCEEETVRDHYEKSHAMHPCTQCDTTPKKWEDLRQHREECHGEYTIEENYIGGAWFLWDHWFCEESVRKEQIVSNVAFFHNYDRGPEKDSGVYVEGTS